MRRRLALFAASCALALAGMLLIVPTAHAGWPPFASIQHCRYHLAGSENPRWCVSRKVYLTVYPWARWMPLW